MAVRMLEKQLSDIWRQQNFGGALLTQGGDEVTVIYPGRINDNRGGDFCDAVIAFAGRTLTGDIELHVRSGDWKGHGHDRDPSYNRVVLHVVYSATTGAATTLQDGREVPVLALEKYVESPATHSTNPGRPGDALGRRCLGVLERLGEAAITAVLDRAGDGRFTEKAARFGAELDGVEAGQVLHQGIRTALGYSKNKAPFLELSRRLPLAVLESIVHGNESDRECCEHIDALILKTAGLAPSDLPETADAAGALAASRRDIMFATDWQMFRARPNNSPQIRMAAMSRLLVRYRRQGLLPGLLNVVKSAAAERAYRCLESALVVCPGGVGEASPAGTSTNMLGRERAADIGVNVVLPFAHALGSAWGEPELSASALLLYHGWPRLGGNCVERHMLVQIGLSRRIINSARRQQGLMEIYSKRCALGRCDICRLGQPEAGDDV